MGFWIFMLLMALLIPLLMLGLGLLFYFRPPRKIQSFYGYRTRRSMASPAAWVFAHQYFGRLWAILGAVTLPLSAVAMFLVLGKDMDTVGLVGGALCGIQCIPMIIPMIFTELALKRTFG